MIFLKKLKINILITVVLSILIVSCNTYRPAIYKDSFLTIESDIPILILKGSSSKIAVHYSNLMKKYMNYLINEYLQKIISHFALSKTELLSYSRLMEKHIPDNYIQQMKILSDATKIPYEDILLANTLVDIQKKIMSCTTFIKTNGCNNDFKGPIFARNLDYQSLNILHKYSLIVIFSEEGKIPFASITWPCLWGVLSGINKYGLTVAVNEVYSGNTSFYAPPYAFILREILENARNTEEAEFILRNRKISTRLNVTISDSTQSFVFEVGNNYIKKIFPENGFIFATNNFKEDIVIEKFNRLNYLNSQIKSDNMNCIKIKDILQKTRLKNLNIQSLIFYPSILKVDISFGKPDRKELQFKLIDLNKFL